MDQYKNKTACFLWDQFAEYHHDRLRDLTLRAGDALSVHGLELAGSSELYQWERSKHRNSFRKSTLFPERKVESISELRVFLSVAAFLLKNRPDYFFICNHLRPSRVALAVVARLIWCKPYLMTDSKFDDRDRSITVEAFKWILLRSYCGALVSGGRSRQYLRWLGFSQHRIATGYDTVDVDRVCAADEVLSVTRRSTGCIICVARHVEKKNLRMLLLAYRKYVGICALKRTDPRRLLMVGDGPLRPELEGVTRSYDIEGLVKFTGFLNAEQVSGALQKSSCLVLTSIEEQWGLVINEAVACGLPVLCSSNCGARDSLVSSGINGFVFEANDPDSVASLLNLILTNEALYKDLCAGSVLKRDAASARNFTDGVLGILGADSAHAEHLP